MSEQNSSKIIYTIVDESPALATHSLLPIVRAFVATANVVVETRDISLSGRILAQFPEYLSVEQRVSDDLKYLDGLANSPEANVVKLPNISASVPQLTAAIRELQVQGYAVPNYPSQPVNEEERGVRARYDRIKGSAVNPILRQGNSDRRAPPSVKAFARKHPHAMGEWRWYSKSHVATMASGDLRHNEDSTVVKEVDAGTGRIEHVTNEGAVTVLKDRLDLQRGDVIDATFMSRLALRDFLHEQIEDAKQQEVLFSIHLKATMMKVSDPVMFGHAVSVFFEDVLARHADALRELRWSPNDGLGTLFERLRELPEAERSTIEADIEARLADGPELAMVNSERGITNLHVPSDVIVDASMPAAIRNSGRMWSPDGLAKDTKFVIPDSSYAGVYQEVIKDCKANGAFDPRTMGTVPNVGLMAKEAEEYGSHDTTFEVAAAGTVRVVAASGHTLLECAVASGDIWRLCRTKDDAIRDWVALAVSRARASGMPAVFWLDEGRPHDGQVLAKVRAYVEEHDTKGLDLRFLSPQDATRLTCERLRRGEDTISVTGNVLRDYLTDLFPILELGTSAKMLSIVPLMNGGGLFETGAGGSAPKLMQQFLEEGHLRWDSLGEYLALVASLEHLAETTGTARSAILAAALDRANERYLNDNKSPSRKVGELDNRGSAYWLARFWAEEVAQQEQDLELATRFGPLAQSLGAAATAIEAELLAVQGEPVDLGGYYRTDPEKTSRVMRPSRTFNDAINEFEATID